MVFSTILVLVSLLCVALLIATFLAGFGRGSRSGAAAAHAATAAAVAMTTANCGGDPEVTPGATEPLVGVLLPFGKWIARGEGSVLYLQGQPWATATGSPGSTLRPTAEVPQDIRTTSAAAGGSCTSRASTTGSHMSSSSRGSLMSAEMGHLYEVMQRAVSF